jgi:predicted ATPase
VTREALARRLVILTGASGAGKTTIANAIEGRRPKMADVNYFDRIGVPTPEAMIAGWGSGEAWQRAASWALHLRREAQAGTYDILDTSALAIGQSVDRVCAYLSE